MLLEQNQNLEDQVNGLRKEADKLKAEKTTLTQRIKVFENQVDELKAALEKKGESDNNNEALEDLKKEVEQLSITNAVYLDKINELVEQMNKMDEDNYSNLEEHMAKYTKLKKQYDELAYKSHMGGLE